MTTPFEKSLVLADELLGKAKLIEKGKSMDEAGIGPEWMVAYARIAERNDRDRRFGLSRYPYEPGPSVAAFTGGLFDHREWPLRKGLERHQSMRAVSEYECKYINAAGFWSSFQETAISLRQESLAQKKLEDAEKFDVWAIIANRYCLRTMGLRAEFYKLAANDPTYAKMILPTLEKRTDVAAADNLDETMSELDSHMHTQLLKAVANLSASNATKKNKGNKGNGGNADGQ